MGQPLKANGTVLAALSLVLSVACESLAPTPTREPDRPTFAEGEAIAVVQTWLGARSSDDDNCLSLINARRGKTRGLRPMSAMVSGTLLWIAAFGGTMAGKYLSEAVVSGRSLFLLT